MAITITTLNNEAAAAHTFTYVKGNDQYSEWRNATASTGSVDGRLTIRQRNGTRMKTGTPTRVASVIASFEVPLTTTIGGSSVLVNEVLSASLTLVTPKNLTTLTSTQRKDLVAYLRNLCTASVVEQLAGGEL